MPLEASAGAADGEVEVRIEPLQAADWSRFLELAAAEQWLVSQAEQSFFREGWRHCMHVLWRADRVCGFVSAVPHRSGGWVGNLIIAPERRGSGYGTLLFDHALTFLNARGCKDVWLTASEMGRPLYEKKGFSVVDRISRWVAVGEGGGSHAAVARPDELEALVRVDRLAWGDCRRDLITHLGRQGMLIRRGRSSALLQCGGDRRTLGPWVAEGFCAEEARQVLQQAVLLAGACEVAVDVVESAGLEAVLEECRFRRRGGTDLMVRSSGLRPVLNGAVALASLGSIG